MKTILTAREQRLHDADIQQAEGISSLSLMERAAFRIYKAMLPKLRRLAPLRISVLVGPGNNGGDGLALARYLSAHAPIQVLRWHSSSYSPDHLQQWSALQALRPRISVFDYRPEAEHELKELPSCGLWIDALFGHGLTRPLGPEYKTLFDRILSQNVPVWAIDLPSGLPADPLLFPYTEPILKASHTFSIDRPAFSMLFPEAAPFLGTCQQIPLSDLKPGTASNLGCWLESEDIRKRIPQRQSFVHKGNQGWLLALGGGSGGEGALTLCSAAALSVGAGKVLALGATSAAAPLLSRCPEAQFLEWSSIGFELPAKATALALGPGAGRAEAVRRWLDYARQRSDLPRVLDADALNMLAESRPEIPFEGTVVLTPHPAELDRLAGDSSSSVQRWEKARKLATDWNCYVVLKNHITWVCSPDGRAFALDFGTPALAKGGSGDALTGLIAGLLAQRLPALDACVLGVALHGRAARLMEAERGTEAVSPAELPQYMGLAIRSFVQRTGDDLGA